MHHFYQQSGLYCAIFTPTKLMRNSIDRVLRTHLARKAMRVLDPACGPGLWLAHFAAQGAEVAGSDIEPSAIAQATKLLPKRGVRVMVGDMRRPPDELGADFNCVINLDNSIGHLADYNDVAEHFASIRQRLAPRGVYLVGLALRERTDTIPEGVVYERGPIDIPGGGFAALRTESLGLQPKTRCERIRQIIITANVKDTPTVIAEQYDLLTFTFEMLKDILMAAGGFELLGCYDATNEDLPSKPFRKGAGDVLLVLRRADDMQKRAGKKMGKKAAAKSPKKPTTSATATKPTRSRTAARSTRRT
jgi:SAM-dependent methyltransferase